MYICPQLLTSLWNLDNAIQRYNRCIALVSDTSIQTDTLYRMYHHPSALISARTGMPEGAGEVQEALNHAREVTLVTLVSGA